MTEHLPLAIPAGLDAADMALLSEAVKLLEADTFTEAALNVVGRVVGRSVGVASRLAPEPLRDQGTAFLTGVLKTAFDGVATTIDQGQGLTGARWLDRALSSSWIDRTSAMVTGALGGAGGVATTAMELPVTTALLMRAIAQIAAREGEDLSTNEARLECLKVFALGGSSRPDAEDAGYYVVRLAVADAVPRVAHRSLQELAPKLLAKVAERFGMRASTKLGSQAVPGLGGAAGALLNLAFVDHFQRKALGHFRVRRLERKYGPEAVRQAYEQIHAGLA